MKRIINTTLALAIVSAVGFAQATDAEQNKEQLRTREAVKAQVQNVKQAAQDDAPNKGVVSGEAQKINEAVKAQVQNKQAVKAQSKNKVQQGPNFIDKDGDGVCDNNATKTQTKVKKGSKRGPGDGTGNKGVGPKDGTGFGAGKGAGTGTGTCDGTGPKGTRKGR